jgi:hypothetical protein
MVIWCPSKFSSENRKPSQGKLRGLDSGGNWDRLLHPHHVACLESFRTLQQVELYRFALVQCAITVLLDGGEVNENILPGRALDETISFSPVEPLYCALLSHKKLLSTHLFSLTFASSVELMLRTTPSEDTKAQPDS